MLRLGSFTCRKATTWVRWLYLPSEGRRAEDFFRPKHPTASAGCKPANLGTKGQHATSRPPKPRVIWRYYQEPSQCIWYTAYATSWAMQGSNPNTGMRSFSFPQRVPVSFPGVKQPGRKGDHSPRPSVDKNNWN
jgi:hypothetical protein